MPKLSEWRASDAQVRRLRPLEGQRGNTYRYDRDQRGLGIRITEKGSRSWVVEFRDRAGRNRRITIGPWPDWSTEQARAEAARIRHLVAQGQDPRAERQRQREVVPTFDQLWRAWLDGRGPQVAEQTRTGWSDLWRRRVGPAIGDRVVDTVTTRELQALHRSWGDRPVTANRALTMLRAVVRWAEANEVVRPGVAPVVRFEAFPERRRDVHLDEAELRRLMGALDEYGARGLLEAEFSAMIRLMASTGCRGQEARVAQIQDFDLARLIWTQPAERTKQRKLHRVTLNTVAARSVAPYLDGRPHDLVFRRGGGGWTRPAMMARFRTVCRLAGIEASLHVLRHSYVTMLLGRGIPIDVAGRMIGHSSSFMTDRYGHLTASAARQASDLVGDVLSAEPGEPAPPIPLRR